MSRFLKHQPLTFALLAKFLFKLRDALSTLHCFLQEPFECPALQASLYTQRLDGPREG